jgi:hypothetical protein
VRLVHLAKPAVPSASHRGEPTEKPNPQKLGTRRSDAR